MAGPGTANITGDSGTRVINGRVYYYNPDTQQYDIPLDLSGMTGPTGGSLSLSNPSGGAGDKTLAQPGSRFGAAPNTIQTTYQIIDLWGFSDQGEGLVDSTGRNIYQYTGEWAKNRYGVDAPLTNSGPNKNTAFDANSADTRFIYYDPNTRMWQRLSPEQTAQLPENILNQNSSRYSGESESPGVGLFYNPETSLFDASPKTIRAYYGQPEYTAEDVIYRADPASVYDTYDPYAPFERTDPYENVGTLLNTRYPYTPPTEPTPSIVRPETPVATAGGDLTPQGSSGDIDVGSYQGGGGEPPPPVSEFATERNKNLDFLLNRAQEGVLGQVNPGRVQFLQQANPDKSTLTEEQYNALMAYQASQGQTGGIGVSGIGNTVDVAALNREAGAEALGGYQSSFDAQQVPAASAKQLENMNFLLQQAEAGKLTDSQAAFLNSFDRRRYDDSVLSQRDDLKAQGLFAEGGGVASMYRDVDAQVTGQGIESFLQRRSDTVNRMLAQRAMAVPRGTMPVSMYQGGDPIAPLVEIDTQASLSPTKMPKQGSIAKLFESDGFLGINKKMREKMAAEQGITVEELAAMYGYSLPQSDGFLGLNRKLREKQQNQMIPISPQTINQPNFVASLNQGGDVTITERTVRDPRDNQYVMEERVVRKQMAFDPDMQTGVMSTLYG